MEAAAQHSNIIGIAVVVLAALLCGLGLERLRQPAIVGYILAGVLLGPSALGLVEDRGQIDTLAELGVLMLLFMIGMELSLRIFKRVWRLAVMTTVIQIGASVGVMLLLSKVFGLTLGLSVLLGFVVAMSSTAVAIKVLDNIGELHTRTGRITIGVLIAQDIAVVPMMLIIGAMADQAFSWWDIIKVLGSVAFMAVLIWYLSRRKRIRLPFDRMVAGHVDLKPLGALAFCFGAAAVSGLLGLSAAYGAFLAGLVIGNSQERIAMQHATKPIESVLMMVFFLSIGLLIDLTYMWANLSIVLTLFLMVTVFKTIMNVGALRLLGQTWNTAFLGGIMLAQIGEFSFLLSIVGVQSGVIGPADSRLVVAVTVLSLALSPVWVITARRLRLLALDGITSGREIMRLVYEPEAEFISTTVDSAKSGTVRAARMLRIVIKRRRNRRIREKELEKEKEHETAKAVNEQAETTFAEMVPVGSSLKPVVKPAVNPVVDSDVRIIEPKKDA
jgi:CPA2 family monovalent cation:H+ antiporter-2